MWGTTSSNRPRRDGTRTHATFSIRPSTSLASWLTRMPTQLSRSRSHEQVHDPAWVYDHGNTAVASMEMVAARPPARRDLRAGPACIARRYTCFVYVAKAHHSAVFPLLPWTPSSKSSWGATFAPQHAPPCPSPESLTQAICYKGRRDVHVPPTALIVRMTIVYQLEVWNCAWPMGMHARCGGSHGEAGW